MSSEWIPMTLGELCEKQGGRIQTGPFGSQLHNSDYVEKGVPVVMPTNIIDSKISEAGIARVGAHDVERLAQHKLDVGDIVFSRRGDVTKNALIRSSQVGWLCGTGCLKVRLGNESIASARFVSYYLRHPETIEWLVRHAVGATMPNLNTDILSRVPVSIPSINTQKRIVAILDALSNSIETLQRQNATLEAIAQRLFRSWFVNFDPVHAKAAGQEPEAMSAELAALFPSEFEESALGLIPKGWDITTLGVVADFIKGRSYKSEELKPSPVALVTLKSFQRGGGFRLDGFKPYVGKYKDNQVVIPGECIVALTDVTQNAEVIGRPAMVYPSDFKNVASLDVGILRPKNKAVTKEFLYCLLREQRYAGHILGHTTGTTVLHLSKDGVPSYQFAIPPSGVVRRFCDIASPLFKTIEANVLVANRLTQLRDHLLPRLISGKLSLADAEAALAAVKPEVAQA